MARLMLDDEDLTDFFTDLCELLNLPPDASLDALLEKVAEVSQARDYLETEVADLTRQVDDLEYEQRKN